MEKQGILCVEEGIECRVENFPLEIFEYKNKKIHCKCCEKHISKRNINRHITTTNHVINEENFINKKLDDKCDKSNDKNTFYLIIK